MRKRMMPTTLVAVVTVVLVVIASTATGVVASRSASPRTCAFELRIGDVLPFTGDLAAYGANMDRAVKQAIVLQNAALKKAGLTRASVRLVGSEDGQTQASAGLRQLATHPRHSRSGHRNRALPHPGARKCPEGTAARPGGARPPTRHRNA